MTCYSVLDEDHIGWPGHWGSDGCHTNHHLARPAPALIASSGAVALLHTLRNSAHFSLADCDGYLSNLVDN